MDNVEELAIQDQLVALLEVAAKATTTTHNVCEQTPSSCSLRA